MHSWKQSILIAAWDNYGIFVLHTNQNGSVLIFSCNETIFLVQKLFSNFPHLVTLKYAYLSHTLNEPFVLKWFWNIVHWSFENYSELWKPSKYCDLPHHSRSNYVFAITTDLIKVPATFKFTVTDTSFPNSNFHLKAQLCLGNKCWQFSLKWQVDFISFGENVYQVLQCEWL